MYTYINGREMTEIDSHQYGHLTFEKGAERIHWRKTVSSSNDTKSPGHSYVPLCPKWRGWKGKL